ncbi:NAD(P)H-dependent glycerol-3-phosphate dehydrogenase [Celeribacter indicus]|uniref:Glycerol-3-phosphate dehydrogenase [NAD(P)+] n=1 Tax=Celeribacter indicus TaxID=1208324 RepID=A0A0B5DNS2_9RHOB|nr:NAD(P)H-dependent glycerol-3-phosphate dehydrogenase [Celeribacter indicus]AJE44859.1 NAD(P)H-dependent glycerol-3-phosphate dehydrogenase [Celeribacter indicus]SDX23347.1 glycerol-3-phosphate dehydrogenase (NAD(P)+) [Celeribacter indicus]
MGEISVLGAGAFGTALAISLARSGQAVRLWARDPGAAREMQAARVNSRRLPGRRFPASLEATDDLALACTAPVLLLAVPMQQLAEFVASRRPELRDRILVACCKGVDLASNRGPLAVIEDTLPATPVAILSGPSFAVDIAEGLPTALTIAARDADLVGDLQERLSTDNIRLYSSLDPVGVEFGGAMKNVIAIACGFAMGEGLGESARAALMTRGFAEMQRLAGHFGADPLTLAGLAGFGDLVLTCTSEKSRNYSHGLRLGRGETVDPGVTVEGVATARAVAQLSRQAGIDMPITRTVTDILDAKLSIPEAVEQLLTRPLKRE